MTGNNSRTLPQAVRLIIFDWDGTLMDSETQIVHAMKGAIEDLALEPRNHDECRNIIGLGLKEAVDKLYPGRDEHFMTQFVDCYRHHWFSIADASDLLPGARETLYLLKEAGFELAVATGKGRVGLDKVLAHTELGEVFAATRCSDETRSKPHPQMLNEILGELDVTPGQALMVGDSAIDVLLAHATGVAVALVTFGYGPEPPDTHRPDYRIDAFSELPAVVAGHSTGRAVT